MTESQYIYHQNKPRSLSLAEELGRLLLEKNWICSVAESCTGGGLAQAITDVAGSSLWFDRGFITYSNQAKQDMLNVTADLLHKYGAVSEEVVIAMVNGAIMQSRSNCAIAISGIAGPGGGCALKPVGTVWISWSIKDKVVKATKYLFTGDRASIRSQAVITALIGLIELLSETH